MTSIYRLSLFPKAATSLLGMGLGASGSSQLSGPLAMAGTTRDLAEAYDASMGSFRPAPPLPKASRQSLPASTVKRLQLMAAKPAVSEELRALLRRKGLLGGEVEDDLGMKGLGEHYRVLERFERNRRLRHEKAVLIDRLHKMNAHLASKSKVAKRK